MVNRKPEISSFIFRLNSLEYQNLQDKVTGTIANLENIQVYKTVSERFVDVFKEQIREVTIESINLMCLWLKLLKNPRARVTDELEACIGCMANTANVTIQRSCVSSQEGGAGAVDGGADGDAVGVEDACVSCYCRPMWCMDCMAKW